MPPITVPMSYTEIAIFAIVYTFCLAVIVGWLVIWWPEHLADLRRELRTWLPRRRKAPAAAGLRSERQRLGAVVSIGSRRRR